MGHTKETTGLGPIISPESVSTLVHAALLRRFTSGIRISSSPPPPGAGAPSGVELDGTAGRGPGPRVTGALRSRLDEPTMQLFPGRRAASAN